MALLCGADLVLEIPSIFAVSSAEDFAAGAVALLDQLGVVTHLCFGSEMGESERFMETAAILADEPDSFSTKLKKDFQRAFLASGKSPGFRSRRNIGSWKLPGNA